MSIVISYFAISLYLSQNIAYTDIYKGGIATNRIKELRLKNAIKQSDLAEMLKFKQNTVSNWETGRSEPPLEVLVQMSSIFDVPVDYILGADAKKKPATVSSDGQAQKLAQILRDAGVDVDCLTEAEMWKVGKIIKAAFEE